MPAPAIGANVIRMSFQWPDPIGFVADILTIVGIPVLAVSIWNLYRDVKNAREPKTVGQGCLQFDDVDSKLPVNLVQLKEIHAIPRVGDTVSLPGEIDFANHLKRYGGGIYWVLSVAFSYIPGDPKEAGQPCPALPARIIIDVKKIDS
jgi:hypothetical protein